MKSFADCFYGCTMFVSLLNSLKRCNLQLTLHCPVCLYRSYFEHVADTVSHWTRQEESKRDTTQDRNDTPKSDSPKGIVL